MARLATLDPRAEEQRARERERQLAKLQRAAALKRERDERSKRALVIREELAKPRARKCECGITTRTTLPELMAMGAGCTAGLWVCPVLDAIRRRLGR